MTTYKQVNIRQAVIIGEALHHLAQGTTRTRALVALRELTEMAERACGEHATGRLDELRKLYPDLKVYEYVDTGAVKLMDQKNTPFWWALFASEQDALEAYHCFFIRGNV